MQISCKVLTASMNMQAKRFYAFGPFRLDPQEHVLLRDGRPVPLAPKAVEILLLLVEKAEHLVDKDDLMKRVWPDTFVEEGNLTKNVFVLRRALGSGDDGHEYIETVPKRGYRFVARVMAVMSNGEDQATKMEPQPSALATPAFDPNALAGLPPNPAPAGEGGEAGQAAVGNTLATGIALAASEDGANPCEPRSHYLHRENTGR